MGNLVFVALLGEFLIAVQFCVICKLHFLNLIFEHSRYGEYQPGFEGSQTSGCFKIFDVAFQEFLEKHNCSELCRLGV